MILNFLGCGCAYRPDLGNTSAWFATGKHLFLLDCGENIFTCLHQKQLLKGYDDVTVIVTHCHSDHAGSLPTLISYAHYVEHKPITVYFPDEDIPLLMKDCGIAPGECHFLQGTKASFSAGVTCTAFPVEHHPDLRCYGYHLTCDTRSFYYSGDARRLPSDILDAFLRRQIDEIYQDTTFLKDQGTSHGSLSYLCDVIPLPLRQYVYPMHFSDNLLAEAESQGFGCCMEPVFKLFR